MKFSFWAIPVPLLMKARATCAVHHLKVSKIPSAALGVWLDSYSFWPIASPQGLTSHPRIHRGYEPQALRGKSLKQRTVNPVSRSVSLSVPCSVEFRLLTFGNFTFSRPCVAIASEKQNSAPGTLV